LDKETMAVMLCLLVVKAVAVVGAAQIQPVLTPLEALRAAEMVGTV
jgi:hypothetical protein